MKSYIITDDVLCFTSNYIDGNGSLIVEKNKEIMIEVNSLKLIIKI